MSINFVGAARATYYTSFSVSQTKNTPCEPLQQAVVIVRNLSCPEVSHYNKINHCDRKQRPSYSRLTICNLKRRSSIAIDFIFYFKESTLILYYNNTTVIHTVRLTKSIPIVEMQWQLKASSFIKCAQNMSEERVENKIIPGIIYRPIPSIIRRDFVSLGNTYYILKKQTSFPRLTVTNKQKFQYIMVLPEICKKNNKSGNRFSASYECRTMPFCQELLAMGVDRPIHHLRSSSHRCRDNPLPLL